MANQSDDFVPLGLVHSEAYDGAREELMEFVGDELHYGRLDDDIELWSLDWDHRIDLATARAPHRLALDWVGGKSRENGSHPDFPGVKYSCDVTAYPRPIEGEQQAWDRDPREAEWANMCAGSSAYPDIPLYRSELVKGRLLSGSDRSGSSGRSRGPAPPWAVLIRRSALDRAWRSVHSEPPDTTPPAILNTREVDPLELPPSTRDEAIKARMAGGRKEVWPRFAELIRDDCGVTEQARGYSDRTIRRRAEELAKLAKVGQSNGPNASLTPK